MIKLNNQVGGGISNIWLQGAFVGFEFVRTVLRTSHDLYVATQGASSIGFLFRSAGLPDVTAQNAGMFNNLWVDLPPNNTSIGILIQPTTTGLVLMNTFIQQGGTSVEIAPSTAGVVNEIQISGGIWDGPNVVGFLTAAANMTPSNNSIQVSGVRITTAVPYAVILSKGIQAVSMQNNLIRSTSAGVVIAGALNSSFINNTIRYYSTIVKYYHR
jgi:hypothetical protein